MPRKKENNASPMPGFDIFGQSLPENDRGVLLRSPYRRKHLAGFVPMWNEFFRCYHLAGVSPLAVYLWAYLRQYEHERREWNAISDISWPGRRDLSDALGVSITHLPNLLQELRQAGLVVFQPVLPGFEELAKSLHTGVQAVRERAAEYGVMPKIDGTLYRTADPHTKTEFALLTTMKFCKGCKAYRYCEGAKEAGTRLAENKPGLKKPSRPQALPGGRQVEWKAPASPVEAVVEKVVPVRSSRPVIARVGTPAAKTGVSGAGDEGRQECIQVKTVAVFNQQHPESAGRIGQRIQSESAGVFKKEHPANPSRVKTSLNQLTVSNQPEITTTSGGPVYSQDNKPGTGELVVVEQENLAEAPQADLELLVRFGLDRQTARQLVKRATELDKEPGYISRIVRYARENARQNPPGMVRRLIERGEERQGRAERWQQQSLFGAAVGGESEGEGAEAETEAGAEGEPDFPGTHIPAESHQPKQREPEGAGPEPVCVTQPATGAAEAPTELQTRLLAAYGLDRAEVDWWRQVIAGLERSGAEVAAEIFRPGLGLRQPHGKLVVVLRNLFDLRRAQMYTGHLERAVAALTGQWPEVEFSQPG